MLHRSGPLGGARYAVTDRLGGVSSPPYDGLNLGGHVGDDPAAVAENRRRLAAALDPPPAYVAYMSQVHGADVAVVTEPPVSGAPVPVADGLVTALPGVALAVLAADCVPVLLADRAARVVGVAHAGRKGVAAGVVGAVVEAMTRLGCDPAAVEALVTPAICAGCYEVPAEMRAEVASRVGQAWATTRSGTASLDLPAAVQAQLAAAGCARVERVATCTAEDPDLFSHRRDAVTGRLAGLVWLP